MSRAGENRSIYIEDAKKRRTVDRVCLCCDKVFKSDGRCNRICHSCKKRNIFEEEEQFIVTGDAKL